MKTMLQLGMKKVKLFNTIEFKRCAVVCGPGGRHNTMPDERVDVPDYLDMIRIYLLTMCDICEME